MPTCATFVKFGAEGLKAIEDIGKAYEEGKQMSERMGIKTLGAYATLGPHDMMLIYEARDEKAAAGMAMSMAAKWGGETETWTMIPMDEFVKFGQGF